MWTQWPFIGRTEEIDHVGRALGDEALTGVVLAGPGGVGKSRLARVCTDLAEQAGFASRRVLGTGSGSSIPLAAFTELLPEVGDGLDALRSARQSIVALAADRPLLLWVDDAHLLDPASATLLLHLIGHERIFVLATVRTGEPTPDAVTSLWKDAGAERFDLEPLDAVAVGHLLEEVLGAAVSSQAVAALHEASRGLPLALRELVASATDAGTLRRDGLVWRFDGTVVISPRLGELIGQRLDGLDDAARRLVEVLALTEPLPVSVIERLGFADALDVLDRRGLVEVVARGDLEARLDHALYGEVALDSMSELARRRWLGDAADALWAERDREEDRFRAVLWWQWAGRSVEPELLLEAARRAYVVTDYGATGELARAAWEAGGSFEAGHLLGFTLSREGCFDEAEAVLARCSDQATDDREHAFVALARSENFFRGLNRADAAVAVCEAAEAAILDRDWRAEVIGGRAMFLFQRGDLPGALGLLEPLLAPDAAPRPFVKAAYAAGPALVYAGRLGEAMAIAARAMPLHEMVWEGDFFQTEPGIHYLTTLVALIEGGRFQEAEALGDLAIDVTRNAVPAYGFAWFSMLRGLVDLHRGRAREAARRFGDASGPFHDGGYRGQERWCHAGAAAAAALIGDIDGACAAMTAADVLADNPVRFNEGHVANARAWIELAAGRPESARSIFAEGAAAAESAGELTIAGLLWHGLARTGGADAAVGPLADLARRVEGELAPVRHSHAVALAAGDGAGLDSVGERFQAMGAELYAAEAACEAARHHRRAGDQRAASASMRRLEHLRLQMDDVRTPALVSTDAPVPLTDREREVATLAADRLSSKEIAERLHLSPRTVDNHLQRIYGKLGVSSRSELAETLGAASR